MPILSHIGNSPAPLLTEAQFPYPSPTGGLLAIILVLMAIFRSVSQYGHSLAKI